MTRTRILLLAPALLCLHCGPADDPDGAVSPSDTPDPALSEAESALSVGTDDSLLLYQSTAGFADATGDKFGQALATGDFDGDGYPDLAIGVPNEAQGGFANAGMVMVFYGSPGGLNTTDWEQFSQSSVAGMANEANDLFGQALAAGDFDDDGRDDLAVGVPNQDVNGVANSGAVAIFYGSAGGLFPTTTALFTQQLLAAAGNEANDQFGITLASGDLDGDDADDLAIGTPYEDGAAVDSGAIAVVYGSAIGLTGVGFDFLDQSNASGSASEANDRFGFSLATGDVDGDGDSELVVGVPYEGAGALTDTGMVVVLKGSSAGLPAGATTYFQTAVPGEAQEAGDRFGFAVAVGDFNGDGYADVAASAPHEDQGGATDSGNVAVLHGGPGALPAGWDEVVTELSAHGPRESGDRAGYTLAAGDFDGDGFADLAVGVPYETEDADVDDDQFLNENGPGMAEVGGVLAFFGTSGGVFPPRAYAFTQRYMGGMLETHDRFGWRLPPPTSTVTVGRHSRPVSPTRTWGRPSTRGPCWYGPSSLPCPTWAARRPSSSIGRHSRCSVSSPRTRFAPLPAPPRS